MDTKLQETCPISLGIPLRRRARKGKLIVFNCRSLSAHDFILYIFSYIFTYIYNIFYNLFIYNNSMRYISSL